MRIIIDVTVNLSLNSMKVNYFTDKEAVAAISKITQGKFMLIKRLLKLTTQIMYFLST